MEYIPPLDGSGSDPYVNPNPALEIEGSVVPAAALEDPQREIVHVIDYAGLEPDGGDLTQLRQAIETLVAAGILGYSGSVPLLTLAATQLTSGVLPLARLPVGLAPRNYLRNGSMRIWQRGPSATFTVSTGQEYNADRWAAVLAGGSGSSITRQLYTGSFRYALRYDRTAASTDVNVRRLVQVFTTEDAIQLAGKTITLAFQARAGANYSAASGTLTTRISWGTGSDESLASYLAGTWTGQTNIGDSAHTLTTTDTRFSRSVSIPSNATQIAVEFRWTPVGTAGAADYVDVTGVVVHPGSVLLDFPHERFADELLECQRFYNKTFDYDVQPAANLNSILGALAGVGTGATNGDVNVNWFFPTEMRIAPSITTFNWGSSGTSWRDAADSTNYARVVGAVGQRSVAIASSTSDNIGGGDRVYLHAIAEAEL